MRCSLSDLASSRAHYPHRFGGLSSFYRQRSRNCESPFFRTSTTSGWKDDHKQQSIEAELAVDVGRSPKPAASYCSKCGIISILLQLVHQTQYPPNSRPNLANLYPRNDGTMSFRHHFPHSREFGNFWRRVGTDCPSPRGPSALHLRNAQSR